MLTGAPCISEPGRLVALAWTARGEVPDEIMGSQSGRSRPGASGETVGFSFPRPAIDYIRSRARTFSDVVGFVPLGVRVVRGRALGQADHSAGAPRVTVISDGS